MISKAFKRKEQFSKVGSTGKLTVQNLDGHTSDDESVVAVVGKSSNDPFKYGENGEFGLEADMVDDANSKPARSFFGDLPTLFFPE